MNIVDIIIAVVALAFILGGLRSGFVRAAGSLLAFFVSIGAAFYGLGWIGDTFGVTFATQPWVTIVAFFVVLIVANKLAGYLVDILDLVRKAIAILPFVNVVNALLGAIFGALQAGALVLVFTYCVVVFVPAGDLRTTIVSSSVIERAVTFETSIGLL